MRYALLLSRWKRRKICYLFYPLFASKFYVFYKNILLLIKTVLFFLLRIASNMYLSLYCFLLSSHEKDILIPCIHFSLLFLNYVKYSEF